MVTLLSFTVGTKFGLSKTKSVTGTLFFLPKDLYSGLFALNLRVTGVSKSVTVHVPNSL